MQTKSKLLLLVTVLLLALGVATMINVSLKFRDYSIHNAVEKAKMTASIVKDGLTSHMVNHIMDKREFFLNQISSHKDIKSLRIIRSKYVIKQFGPALPNEMPKDAIDKEVLKTGKIFQKVTENAGDVTLRVTIPYKANGTGTPNCFACHNVQEGDTLGAISMEFDISGMRDTGILTISNILLINIVFIIIMLLLLNHYVTPYMELFNTLQDGVKKAYHGDFSHEFKTTVSGDGKDFVNQINPLFRKIEETFGHIKDDLSTFIPNNNTKSDDPLYEAKVIINELSDIYKFKKTIELDSTKDVIFSRSVDILKIKFNIQEFTLYEVSATTKLRKLLYTTDKNRIVCNSDVTDNIEYCRAYRTSNEVISTDFINLCQHCHADDLKYICIPFSINSDYSLVLSITTDDENEFNRIHKLIPSIENYFEAAKPVIESKMLMDKLRETSLKDPMTGLYNRRFLDEFADKIMNQATRNNDTYAVFMLDVDYFKMVNDTYGHDVGDKVIVEIGKLVRSCIRDSDLGIRYGGEEFVVMLHNADEEGMMKVANTIHDSFGELVFDAGNGETLQKTISIGVSNFPKDGDTIWKCIKYADTALYVAKTTGRDKIVEYEKSMNENEALR